MTRAEVTLGPTPASVAAARRFLADVLGEWSRTDPAWEAVQWPALQVLSELATNAVLHAATDFTVAVDQEGDALRLEVHDASPRALAPHRYGLRATTGRGLTLVGTLSRDWGVGVTARGKVVWCVVTAPSPGDEVDLAGFLSDEDVAALDALQGSGTAPASG